MEEPIEELEFLVRSEARVRILEELLDGRRTNRELRDEIDVDRTTIARNLDALRENGWIREDHRSYVLEPYRKPAVLELVSVLDSLRLTERLGAFLRWTDPSQFDFDIERLTDAEIWTAEPGDPWAMVNRHVATLREAEEVHALLPETGVSAKRAMHRGVVERGMGVELTVSPDVFDTFRSDPEYAEYYRKLRRHDCVDYLITDDEIPFYLGVLDGETVQIGVSEDGVPRALLETDDGEVRAWAERVLDGYRERASPAPEN